MFTPTTSASARRRRAQAPQARRDRRRPLVVEPHPVAQRALVQHPPQPRRLVARLGVRGDRPDLDEPEAEHRQTGHADRVLVEAGGQPERARGTVDPTPARHRPRAARNTRCTTLRRTGTRRDQPDRAGTRPRARARGPCDGRRGRTAGGTRRQPRSSARAARRRPARAPQPREPEERQHERDVPVPLTERRPHRLVGEVPHVDQREHADGEHPDHLDRSPPTTPAGAGPWPARPSRRRTPARRRARAGTRPAPRRAWWPPGRSRGRVAASARIPYTATSAAGRGRSPWDVLVGSLTRSPRSAAAGTRGRRRSARRRAAPPSSSACAPRTPTRPRSAGRAAA